MCVYIQENLKYIYRFWIISIKYLHDKKNDIPWLIVSISADKLDRGTSALLVLFLSLSSRLSHLTGGLVVTRDGGERMETEAEVLRPLADTPPIYVYMVSNSQVCYVLGSQPMSPRVLSPSCGPACPVCGPVFVYHELSRCINIQFTFKFQIRILEKIVNIRGNINIIENTKQVKCELDLAVTTAIFCVINDEYRSISSTENV
uniref:Uncharacterized protein n=1 Tax=Timema poppense TaxID=170557 RepID=A0A7R9GWT5_TIMPO|nr:unnamed protein product [Timema poppensis]